MVRPLSTESGYVENGFSTNTEYRTTKWPGGGPSNLANKETGVSPVTEEGTYNMYCNREPRFYVPSSIMAHGWELITVVWTSFKEAVIRI